MKAEITKKTQGEKGLRLTVSVKVPPMKLGEISISEGKREMHFEYDPAERRFIDVVNVTAGGYLQYQNEQGDLFELDSLGELKAVEG